MEPPNLWPDAAPKYPSRSFRPVTNSGNLLRQMVSWFNRNLIKLDSNFIIAIKNCFKSSSTTFRNLSIIRFINNNIPIFFIDTNSLQCILWRKRSLWRWIQIGPPVLSSHHKMQVLLYHTLTPQDMIYSNKPVDPGPQRASTQQQVNENTESSG